MTEKKLYRLEVTPDVYQIIEAEAFLRGRTLKSIASEIIANHCSKEAINLSRAKSGKMEEPKEHRDEKPEKQTIIKPECGAVTDADISKSNPKRRRLEKDQPAIKQIKELWTAGERSTTKISQAIGYPRSTTGDHMGRMKDKGELVD